jgi:hypothetical protein
MRARGPPRLVLAPHASSRLLPARDVALLEQARPLTWKSASAFSAPAICSSTAAAGRAPALPECVDLREDPPSTDMARSVGSLDAVAVHEKPSRRGVAPRRRTATYRSEIAALSADQRPRSGRTPGSPPLRVTSTRRAGPRFRRPADQPPPADAQGGAVAGARQRRRGSSARARAATRRRTRRRGGEGDAGTRCPGPASGRGMLRAPGGLEGGEVKGTSLPTLLPRRESGASAGTLADGRSAVASARVDPGCGGESPRMSFLRGQAPERRSSGRSSHGRRRLI